ncbi:SDR family oxidoreductase [uncultured Roseibium sp.]|uniref:SDR family oxidoreductase n=1 Tax=uncultured Roseibium sp. TaxID=1936171 RepID=UPI00262B9A2E|nr:SDR family oxidoreductase [uncultured Roseibium sp.]
MTEQTSKPVAVVTGAAGDIGAAIGEQLAETYTIAAVDMDQDSLEKVVGSLQEKGLKATALQFDLTNADSLCELAASARSLGPIEVLINNAGAASALSLHQMTRENLAKDVGLNLEAALNCFKMFEDDLIACGHASVVNIASVNGLGTYGHPAYSAAKAGLIHATKALAVEYGKYGLRANAVAPGTVKTQAWKLRQSENPQVFEEALRWYPFKALPEPADIAQAVAFLLSPAARCITGVCLPVDSGLSAGSPALPRTFTQSPDFDGT